MVSPPREIETNYRPQTTSNRIGEMEYEELQRFEVIDHLLSEGRLSRSGMRNAEATKVILSQNTHTVKSIVPDLTHQLSL
jgi:hypothetical protein